MKLKVTLFCIVVAIALCASWKISDNIPETVQDRDMRSICGLYCQLRCVRRSLHRDSAATLVHAFVTRHIDYGNAVLANAPKIWTEKLQ